MSTTYALRTTDENVTHLPARPALRVVAPAGEESGPAWQDVRPGASLRLTRRGRAVVLAAGLLLVLAVFLLVPGGSSASGEDRTEVVTVGTGQTLWQIASVRAEGGDVREMVEHIKDLNGLDSGILLAGQDLRVPALVD
ncbi:LysM peptidoglycan-binding domain-containing protein [Nocardioides nanhaiensis]|uniref:LysM domain-containing protein n=1 Tax=Nocardioides nanhaiensis TaxID=1476871 RepID=A0ABP8W617_9ACTN